MIPAGGSSEDGKGPARRRPFLWGIWRWPFHHFFRPFRTQVYTIDNTDGLVDVVDDDTTVCVALEIILKSQMYVIFIVNLYTISLQISMDMRKCMYMYVSFDIMDLRLLQNLRVILGDDRCVFMHMNQFEETEVRNNSKISG